MKCYEVYSYKKLSKSTMFLFGFIVGYTYTYINSCDKNKTVDDTLRVWDSWIGNESPSQCVHFEKTKR